jgi:hypothetical protein
MWYFLIPIIFSAGFLAGAMWAGRKCAALQEQLDAKRESWCSDCNIKEQLAGARDTLKRQAKSNAALGGVVNAQVYEIKRLKRTLAKANVEAGESYFDLNVAR